MNGWAIVELMGHVKMAGHVTEEDRFGAKMGRCDVPGVPIRCPECGGGGQPNPPAHRVADHHPEIILCDACKGEGSIQPWTTVYFGASSVYRVTAVSKEAAVAVALKEPVEPVGYYHLPDEWRGAIEEVKRAREADMTVEQARQVTPAFRLGMAESHNFRLRDSASGLDVMTRIGEVIRLHRSGIVSFRSESELADLLGLEYQPTMGDRTFIQRLDDEFGFLLIDCRPGATSWDDVSAATPVSDILAVRDMARENSYGPDESFGDPSDATGRDDDQEF